jgi:hypothetical protein
VNRETGPEADRNAPARSRGQGTGELVPASRNVLGGLAGDPRLPIWLIRAGLALAAGIGVTLWVGWRFGLTAAALVAIADTIYRSRTTSVIPASVRVTSAQRRTERRLLLLRASGYVALNRCAIPGSDSVIDHLVIGPGGVFALDSERWDRRLPVRSTGDLLYHGPYSQRDRLKHARWEATQAAGLLTEALGEAIAVRPAMAIYGPTVPWIVASLSGVDVFGGRRVRKYFRRQTRTSRGSRLDSGQIEDIHVAAALALPPTR